MRIDLSIVAALFLYKALCLLVGLIFCYFGYRLFIKNIWGQVGELEATVKETKLVLKAAVPGSFFALLGAIVIIVTLLEGLDLESNGSLEKPILPAPEDK